jgi:arsenite methyltransferase
LPEAELYEVTAHVGLTDGKIMERFDCYQGTFAKASLSKDLFVQGVNFFARKTSPSREANSHQTSSWLG